MHVTLRIWRQSGPDVPGNFVTCDAAELSTDMSFLDRLSGRPRVQLRTRFEQSHPRVSAIVTMTP